MAIGRRKRLHASYLRKLDHIRREYWRNYRPRVEQEALAKELRANQERADKINELRRVEGMLQTMHPQGCHFKGAPNPAEMILSPEYDHPPDITPEVVDLLGLVLL